MGIVQSLTVPQREQYKEIYDENCKKAAKAITNADILLFAHGAGMSADSGLPVFADIAKFEAYAKMRLTYPDLCVPSWIETDPEIFFGFWGKCYNDYKQVTPNNGYNIVKSWKDKFFTENSEKNEKWIPKLKQKFVDKMYQMYSLKEENADVGPFFIYTSNIDSHSLKPGLFEPKEVYEIHGSTDKWQCSDACTLEHWELPADFQFEVDMNTMRSPPSAVAPCKSCGKPARPWVLMFEDGSWAGAVALRQRYSAWREAVQELVKEENLKLVILEVGAGTNVPTVRGTSESICKAHNPEQVTLIRINLDFPHTGSNEVEEKLIGIMERGLPALTKIDQYINDNDNDNDNETSQSSTVLHSE